MMRLLTFGHGTLSAEEFIGLLRGAQAARLIDIRSVPSSRHNPQFGRAEMERWLATAGVDYRWERSLGGFRTPSPESPNTALRHPAFRGYADYMLTQEFAAAADALLEFSRHGTHHGDVFGNGMVALPSSAAERLPDAGPRR